MPTPKGTVITASIRTRWGWKEFVENLLYKQYIRFEVKDDDDYRSTFTFTGLTAEETGYVRGLFDGIQATSKRF